MALLRLSLLLAAVGLCWAQSSRELEQCALHDDELQTCETCIGKGTKCFWCGGERNKCLPYDWYFPNCDLKDAKHNVCWVSTSAAVIVAAVLGGIAGVLLIAGMCYCFCRCRQYSRQRAAARGIKWNQKQSETKAEMQQRHEARRSQRQAELDEYRLKYGLPPKSDGSTTGASKH